MLEKTKAVMLGHAVADALGVPVEFCRREKLAANPIKDMEGFGTYPLREMYFLWTLSHISSL